MDIQVNQQLKIALQNYLQEDIDLIPAESDLTAQHTFSASFEHRMRRLLARAKHQQAHRRSSPEYDQLVTRTRPFPAGRKRLLLTAIILALLLSMLSVTAAREMVFGFFVEIYAKFSTIIFNSDPGTSPTAGLPSSADDLQDILPTVLPAGYKHQYHQLSDDRLLYVYTNQNNDVLSVEVTISSALSIKIDTEGVESSEIKLRQTKGLFYSNRGFQNLVWQEGSYVYAISGKITKDELLDLAESINRK